MLLPIIAVKKRIGIVSVGGIVPEAIGMHSV
jgi:hypothetical protein